MMKLLPIKLHPSREMSARFVAGFIAEMPEEFETLKSVLREGKDLVSEIRKFEHFLARSGFDQTYSSLEVFGSLCETARR